MASIRGANGARFNLTKSFRLDLVQSIEARDDGIRVRMIDGEDFGVAAEDAKRLEAAMAIFNAGYESVLTA